jgi:hypothetical protein
MTLLHAHADAQIHHASWFDLLDVVRDAGGCDLLCSDPPYSERTHAGHDTGLANQRSDDEGRRELSYAYWTPDDARAFVHAWHPLTRGWMAIMTDHVLAPAFEAAMKEVGRYAFSPLTYVATGSRVRLQGDGPSQWSVQIVTGLCASQIVCSRPRTAAFADWGTLPGAYILPPGMRERLDVTGGKPTWIMRQLVKDYSRDGELVVDPCCGAGTTVVSARMEGRRSIGGDASIERATIAANRIAATPVGKLGQQPLF